ncbi:HipA domain-containing protein [Rheinheimera baltica]|uniref:HipA domain-containing protein n=1 Tax=Rheinheimera baltica TaxID=67576 RepID=UPI00047F1D29|nr:HipA domain-containing protein [Rheinheimera baltica]
MHGKGLYALAVNYCVNNATPTTHIIKLPIGEIHSDDHVIDMTHSVENEYLCLNIAKAYGFDTAECLKHKNHPKVVLMFYGAPAGLLGLSCPRPSGQLKLFQFAPGKLVEQRILIGQST